MTISGMSKPFHKLFFPRARAKGSRCLRLTLRVWIELRGITRRIEKVTKKLGFFNIPGQARGGLESTQSGPKLDPKSAQSWPKVNPKLVHKWTEVCPDSNFVQARCKLYIHVVQTWCTISPIFAHLPSKLRTSIVPTSSKLRLHVFVVSSKLRPNLHQTLSKPFANTISDTRYL